MASSDMYLTLGHVEIGTTAPGSLLEISGTNTSQGLLKINNTVGAAGYVSGIDLRYGGTDTAFIRSIMNAGGPTDLMFGTYNGSGTVTEKVRITSGGNVGIGTIDPASLLDVRGTIGQGIQGERELASLVMPHLYRRYSSQRFT